MRLDEEGRLKLPKEILQHINLGEKAKVSIEKNRIIIEPLQNPLESLTEQMVNPTGDIEREIANFKRAADEFLGKLT